MPRPRFSEMLSQRRHQLGLTTAQAADDLKFKERVLVALEAGDFDSIPKGGYAQGLVATYARYLGLDEQEVVYEFNHDQRVYRHSQQLARSRRAHYPQGRLYTSRVPQHARRSASSYDRQRQDSFHDPSATIQMRPVSHSYQDDMRYDQQAQPYRAASTESACDYSRNVAARMRPAMDQLDQDRRTRQRRTQHRKRPKQSLSETLAQQNTFWIVIIVGLLLTILIIYSVSSCVSRTAGGDDNTRQTVPVTKAEVDNSNDQSQDNSAQAVQDTSSNDQNKDNGDDAHPSVVVSVKGGGRSWVEVTVDGSSQVAQTISGPWSQTYSPSESMTIQVGNASAVTVTKNGQTQNFDAKASGVGTMTIKAEVSGDSNSSSDQNKQSNSSSSDAANATSPTKQQSAQNTQSNAAVTTTTQNGTANSTASTSNGRSQ
ncbi:MAG: DUF4115 domain-containing protein [Coriobacteriaceae bacterium]|nr:MAG: DUF4115 domain-containing protein [Coriobacteriaceae bacterium]